MGRSGIGAPFPFPLAPAEVGYLNGHRPFSLGGGNGSKCPIAVIDGATRREGAAVAIKRCVRRLRYHGKAAGRPVTRVSPEGYRSPRDTA